VAIAHCVQVLPTHEAELQQWRWGTQHMSPAFNRNSAQAARHN
jgi:hypothetical protein